MDTCRSWRRLHAWQIQGHYYPCWNQAAEQPWHWLITRTVTLRTSLGLPRAESWREERIMTKCSYQVYIHDVQLNGCMYHTYFLIDHIDSGWQLEMFSMLVDNLPPVFMKTLDRKHDVAEIIDEVFALFSTIFNGLQSKSSECEQWHKSADYHLGILFDLHFHFLSIFGLDQYC